MGKGALFLTAAVVFLLAAAAAWGVPVLLYGSADEPDAASHENGALAPPTERGAPQAPTGGAPGRPESGGPGGATGPGGYDGPSPDEMIAKAQATILALFVASIVLGLVGLISIGKLFAMAGEPWWGVIVPFYNVILMLRIAGRPAYWILGLFLPVVNIIVALVISIEFCGAYGKGPIFGIFFCLFAPLAAPILVFTADR